MSIPSISTLRSIAGAAYKTWLVSSLPNSYSPGQTFALDDTASWTELDPTTLQSTGNPLGTSGPFMVILEAGTEQEEKIRCSSVNLSTGVVTVWTDGTNNGRGAENSTIQTHAGSPNPPETLNCYPCIEAGLLLQMQQEIIALMAGGVGPVASVTAGDATITIGGTPDNPTVSVTSATFDAYGSAATALTAANAAQTSANAAQATANARAQNLVPTAVQTSNYSASAQDFVLCNTSGGAFTVTLPTAPADKTRVGMKLITAGNVLTYACGGSDVINKTGGATSGTIYIPNQAITLQYQSSTAIWVVVSDDIPASQLLRNYVSNAAGLRTARAKLGSAARARFDIVILSNSVGRGVGGSSDWAGSFVGYAGNPLVSGQTPLPFLSSDNYLGWAGQLRTILNSQFGTDPGEGFIFVTNQEPRLENNGTAGAAYGPMAQTIALTTSQYIRLNQTTMSSGWNNTYFSPTNYIGIIQWDGTGMTIPTVKVGGSTVTMYTTPGGNVPLTYSAGNKYVVGYVAAPTSGQAFEIDGPAASGNCRIAGLDLIGDTNGVHVHNISVAGSVTAQILGGQSGAGNLSYSNANTDYIIRATYEWLQGPQPRTVTANLATTGVITLTSGYFNPTDQGYALSGTGVTTNSTLVQYIDSTHAIINPAPTSQTGITLTITPPKTTGLVIIAHEELNDYSGQGPAGTGLTGSISGSTLTLPAFYLTDPGNVLITGPGITGGGGQAKITAVLSPTTATIAATGGSTIANASGSTYARVVPATTGGNTPTTSAANIQHYLLNDLAPGTGPLAAGWDAIIIGGPRRYPDGTNSPAPSSYYAQSAYISAIGALANNTTISSYLSQVASMDLSLRWGSVSQAISDGLQPASNSVHPTQQGHGDIALAVKALFDLLANENAISTSVPA